MNIASQLFQDNFVFIETHLRELEDNQNETRAAYRIARGPNGHNFQFPFMDKHFHRFALIANVKGRIEALAHLLKNALPGNPVRKDLTQLINQFANLQQEEKNLRG